MKFHEKLNLLMNLQSIPNNKLAKALSVDPSLISRWRNGTRDLTKHSEYVAGIATYFASQTNKEQLMEILDLTASENINQPALIDKIWHWLSDDITPNAQWVNPFIARFNQVQPFNQAQPLKKSSYIPNPLHSIPTGQTISVEVYHGNTGKRESVIKLLTTVLSQNKICTLKLYTDDSMDWMMEDPEFYSHWSDLLSEIVERGHRMIVIHSIDQRANEINDFINQWMPLYMTGLVEPFYDPGHQASSFKHTLFLAPGIIALKSNIMAVTNLSEQLLYQDSGMIEALEAEFNTYLKSCRPLIKVFTMNEIEAFRSLFHEFEAQNGNVMTLSKTPTFSTLPLVTLSTVLAQMTMDSTEAHVIKQVVDSHYKYSFDAFIKNLQTCKHYDWLYLPEISHLKDFADSYTGPHDLFVYPKPQFEPNDYVHHIEHILELLQKNKAYHVQLSKHAIPENLFIALKQDVGVIVCKTDKPPVFMALNHATMIHAFENFIESFSDTVYLDHNNKANTIKIIETWLEQAKKVLKSN